MSIITRASVLPFLPKAVVIWDKYEKDIDRLKEVEEIYKFLKKELEGTPGFHVTGCDEEDTNVKFTGTLAIFIVTKGLINDRLDEVHDNFTGCMYSIILCDDIIFEQSHFPHEPLVFVLGRIMRCSYPTSLRIALGDSINYRQRLVEFGKEAYQLVSRQRIDDEFKNHPSFKINLMHTTFNVLLGGNTQAPANDVVFGVIFSQEEEEIRYHPGTRRVMTAVSKCLINIMSFAKGYYGLLFPNMQLGSDALALRNVFRERVRSEYGGLTDYKVLQYFLVIECSDLCHDVLLQQLKCLSEYIANKSVVIILSSKHNIGLNRLMLDLNFPRSNLEVPTCRKGIPPTSLQCVKISKSQLKSAVPDAKITQAPIAQEQFKPAVLVT